MFIASHNFRGMGFIMRQTLAVPCLLIIRLSIVVSLRMRKKHYVLSNYTVWLLWVFILDTYSYHVKIKEKKTDSSETI